jgi:hypothetical protein
MEREAQDETGRATGEPRSARRRRLSWLVLLVLPVLFGGLWLACRSRTRWELHGVRVVDGRAPALLRLQLVGLRPGGRADRTVYREAELELASGGMQSDQISGAAPARRLARPSCEAAAAPRQAGGELLLAGRLLCDGRSGPLVDLDGDRLVAYQTLEGDDGKLMLARLTRGGRVAWRRGEADWVGERGRDAQGYRVAFATRLEERVLIVLQQAGRRGELHVMMVDARTGTRAWSRRFD